MSFDRNTPSMMRRSRVPLLLPGPFQMGRSTSATSSAMIVVTGKALNSAGM
jgi:hypothetical protein